MADTRVGVAGKAFDVASGDGCRGAGVQTSLPRLAAGAVRAAGWALLLSATAVTAQTPPFTGVGSQFEMVYWQSVDTGADPTLYEAYLSKYPNGTFAALARAKLARLRQASAAGAVSDSAVGPAPGSVRPPSPPPSADPQAETPSPPRRATASLTTSVPGPREAPPSTSVSASVSSAPIGPTNVAFTGGAQSRSGQATSGPAPFVTDAVPTQGPSDSENSDALRRLLGALGDSQRVSSVSSQPPLPQSPQPQSPQPQSSGLAASAVTLPVVGAPIGQPASGATPADGGAGLVPAVSAQAASATAGSVLPAASATALIAGSAAAGSTTPRPIAVGPLPASFALPPRPALVDVPSVALPATFCSADARNAFHDGPYITALEAAKRNNDAAIAYMHHLQDLYDRNQLSGDVNPMNALAAEAQAYGPQASAAFKAQSTLVSAFNTLMAVPIIQCDPPK